MKQLWRVELEDKDTGRRWSEDVIAEPPLAQASAEVKAIKDAVKRGIESVRCTHSSFVRNELS